MFSLLTPWEECIEFRCKHLPLLSRNGGEGGGGLGKGKRGITLF